MSLATHWRLLQDTMTRVQQESGLQHRNVRPHIMNSAITSCYPIERPRFYEHTELPDPWSVVWILACRLSVADMQNKDMLSRIPAEASTTQFGLDELALDAI